MAVPIDPVSANLKLAQLLNEGDLLAQAPAAPAAPTYAAPAPAAPASADFSGSLFEDILSKAIESLNGVSKTEAYANQLVEKYARGEAELQDVMVAQAKMSIVVQLAVTTVNSAVNTFKEITGMQI